MRGSYYSVARPVNRTPYNFNNRCISSLFFFLNRMKIKSRLRCSESIHVNEREREKEGNAIDLPYLPLPPLHLPYEYQKLKQLNFPAYPIWLMSDWYAIWWFDVLSDVHCAEQNVLVASVSAECGDVSLSGQHQGLCPLIEPDDRNGRVCTGNGRFDRLAKQGELVAHVLETKQTLVI